MLSIIHQGGSKTQIYSFAHTTVVLSTKSLLQKYSSRMSCKWCSQTELNRQNINELITIWILTLVQTADTDNKTRLSDLARVGGVNRIGDKSATENFEIVLSSLEMRWGLLKTVLTCRQFYSHHGQDKTRLDSFVLSMSAGGVKWTKSTGENIRCRRTASRISRCSTTNMFSLNIQCRDEITYWWIIASISYYANYRMLLTMQQFLLCVHS